jgi:hypothetical protein
MNRDISLSKTTKSKIILNIIKSLKEIENKDLLYIHINDYDDEGKILEKIAKRSGIRLGERYESEYGEYVDIGEFISITFDSHVDKIIHKLEGRPSYHKYSHKFEFNVDEKLIEAVEEFEEKNIPPSGPCKTHIGELFRAIQRIQYRAMNDGDLCWEVDSPTFMSYMFLMSQIDKLNCSSASYNQETGQYGFKFTDEYLKDKSWDGKISVVIEDVRMETANFIKYQLMDLLLNGKIKDETNEFDSRDFSRLKKSERYY